MMKYLAGVLTVIAAGVLLVAFSLLGPQAAALGSADQFASGSVYASGQPSGFAPRFGAPGRTTPRASQVETAQVVPAPRQTTVRTIDRPRGRDWKKTAMIIGGSSAAGAGVGAIFGGKKGALIGAAIGGGASTIYETTKN